MKVLFGITLIAIAATYAIAEEEDDNKFKCSGVVCKAVPETCNSIKCELGVRIELLNYGDPTFNVHTGAIAQDQNNYVAVGFSKDGQMGEDIVIMCIPNNTVTVMRNPGGHDPPVPTTMQPQVTGKALFKNGRVDCSFILPIRFGIPEGLTFDLTQGQFNVLVVTGQTVNGAPTHHNRKVVASLFGGDFINSQKPKPNNGSGTKPQEGSSSGQASSSSLQKTNFLYWILASIMSYTVFRFIE